MAESSITLQPGIVSTVSTGMAAGTTIYNGDANNAVWISENPMPGPGSGMRIGPKGSLSWSTAGSPVYGAPDAGVTAPVSLTLSPNVANLVNPVDVGAAVAAQLLAQGIPSVLLGKTVRTGPVAPPAAGASWVGSLPVGQYASAIISITAPKNQLVTVSWQDANKQTIASKKYVLAAGPVSASSLTIQTNVKADYLAIYLTDGTDTGVTIGVYASNRTLPETVTGINEFYTAVIPSNAYNTFDSKTFPKVFTTAGGLHTVHLTPNGSGVKGYFGAYLLDDTGTPVAATILDSSIAPTAGPGGEPEITYNVNFPPGTYLLWWQHGSAALTYQTTMNIYGPAS